MATGALTETTSVMAPADDAAAVTPNNSTGIPVTRGIYVGGAGSLHVLMLSGADVTFASVIEGQIYPLRVKQVFATGTTATGIIALY